MRGSEVLFAAKCAVNERPLPERVFDHAGHAIRFSQIAAPHVPLHNGKRDRLRQYIAHFRPRFGDPKIS